MMHHSKFVWGALLLGLMASTPSCWAQPVSLPSSPQLPGGWQAAAVQSPGVKAAADFCVAQLNSDAKLQQQAFGSIPTQPPYILDTIISTQVQVTAGLTYQLVLEVQDGLSVSTNTWRLGCEVLSQPWNNQAPWQLQHMGILLMTQQASSKASSSSTSSTSSSSTGAPGAHTKGNTHDPIVQQAAGACLLKLSSDASLRTKLFGNDRTTITLGSIEQVEQQVVSGTLYTLGLNVRVVQQPAGTSGLVPLSCKVLNQAWQHPSMSVDSIQRLLQRRALKSISQQLGSGTSGMMHAAHPRRLVM